MLLPTCKETTSEETLERGFYNTYLLKKATHPQERNHFSLFSYSLLLLYLERRSVPKHNPYQLKV